MDEAIVCSTRITLKTNFSSGYAPKIPVIMAGKPADLLVSADAFFSIMSRASYDLSAVISDCLFLKSWDNSPDTNHQEGILMASSPFEYPLARCPSGSYPWLPQCNRLQMSEPQ